MHVQQLFSRPKNVFKELDAILDLIKPLFPPPVVDLFQFVLKSIYFLYHSDFYEQVDGVPVLSSLSPIIADFYVEAFEWIALQTAQFKPTCFKRFVDDTLLWPHSLTSLHDFVVFLNSLHVNIQYTMELEQEGELPFRFFLQWFTKGKMAH